MNLITALDKIKSFKQPIIQTKDAAALLGVDISHASKILSRLADYNHLIRLMRGLWAFPDGLNPLMLPEALTNPFPSYISLQTALYYHGMISQIPSIIYAVTLDRARVIKTPLAVISLHHINPLFFLGYEVDSHSQIKMATAEKALIDFFYFMPAKSKLFRALPELELPDTFDIKKAYKMIEEIHSKSRRVLVENCLKRLKRY